MGSERFPCIARRVTDEAIRTRILTLRDSAPRMDRVVFEMAPK